MNLLLIGARGCGKSSVGRKAAHLLNRPFVDLDDLTLATFSEATVHDVWRAHGESSWRAAEFTALADVLGRNEQVIALGGGTPTIPEASALLRVQQAAGRVMCVYLHCEAVELFRRLSEAPGDRPSLTGQGTAAEVAQILAQREPLYRDLADVVINVTGQSIDATANAIVAILR